MRKCCLIQRKNSSICHRDLYSWAMVSAGSVKLLVRNLNRFLERVSKIPPESNPKASEVEEGAVVGEQMLMTLQQAAKLPEPGIGSLHDPTALVAPQFAFVFIAPFLVLGPVRRNQFDASLLQSPTQRVAVVGAIGNHPLGLLPRPALPARDADLGERGFRQRNFCRRGTFQPNSQRKTLTVDQYHPLRALATLGFTDRRAPFFAGAKLPSRKVSSHRSRPCSSSPPSSARQASSQTPSSCHRCKRRQQVEGEGNSSGRKRQAAPVCRIHRMPSKQARFGAGGRPRLSRRNLGFGSKGSMNCHCSSLNSFCRFFMTEAHQRTCLTHKYLL